MPLGHYAPHHAPSDPYNPTHNLTQFHRRVANMDTHGMSVEDRLNQLEYTCKVLNKQVESLEMTVKLQNSLIMELDTSLKKNQSKLLENVRDIGLAVVDLDFVRDTITSLVNQIHHH
jgi:uncharacterized coiled-coil protein SlyX